MRKIFLVYISWILLSMPAYCVYADDSVDASIKSKYQTDKIEQDLLPALPKVLPISAVKYDKQPTVFSEGGSKLSKEEANYNKEYKQIRLKKGTKFKVKCYSALSGNTPRGSRVAFVTVYPETSRYITIPAGTVIKAQIVDSHPPQFLGNGGLVQIKANEISYKNATYYIEGNVVNANYKKVFINNIKGKHSYMRNMSNLIKPGKRFFGKTVHMSKKLTDGPQVILAPIALASGAVVLAANVVVAPALAIFSTGGKITLPAGTYYELKLKEDAIIKDY